MILAGDAADGSGRRITSNDDHGSDFDTHWRNSRIAGRFLHAGACTIEVTTFHRHRDDRPQRSTGDYTLTVNVDYRTAITGSAAQAELRVENGETVTRKWTYEPASARVSAAPLVMPLDGLDTRITAVEGDATLTATPSKVGAYDVYVAHSNGGTTASLHTRITSYCPTGQIELPSDCGTELPALRRGADVIVRNPPHGFSADSACHETVVTESLSRLWCRRVQDSRTYILRSDPRISETGDGIVNSRGRDLGRIWNWRAWVL